MMSLSVYIVNSDKDILYLNFYSSVKSSQRTFISRTVISCDPTTLKSQYLEYFEITVIE